MSSKTPALIAAGPDASSLSTLTGTQWVWAPTATNNSVGATMNWVTGVTVSLVGGSTKDEPFHTMNGWYSKNKKSLTAAKLDANA